MLRGPLIRHTLSAQGGGTNISNLNQGILANLAVPLPPLVEQRRIADVLSTYDDLIENNTRRIAILEEVARRVFEEWFVHFRAPGCEGLPLLESELGPMPSTWTVKRLGDVLELKYGKALTAATRVEGPFPVYGSSGVVGTHAEAIVAGPGIILGRKGNVGSVHWSDLSFFPIDTVFYVASSLPLHYVYMLLKRQRFLNSDAAVPGLNRAQALAIEFQMPPASVVGVFANLVAPSFALSRSLAKQNTNLQAQRDLLLPKLISGEIEVVAATLMKEAAE